MSDPLHSLIIKWEEEKLNNPKSEVIKFKGGGEKKKTCIS